MILAIYTGINDRIECHGYEYELVKQCEDYAGIYEKLPEDPSLISAGY